MMALLWSWGPVLGIGIPLALYLGRQAYQAARGRDPFRRPLSDDWRPRP